MFSIFKSKSEKQREKLRKIYEQGAKSATKDCRNKSEIINKLSDFDSEFIHSDVYKEYEKLARDSGWSIFDFHLDESKIVSAMLTQGISRSQAEKVLRMFKSMTGL